MRLGFELQVALTWIVAVVVLQRPLDIDRVCDVPFDKVALVTVHFAHQVGKRCPHTLGQAAPESGGSCGQFKAQVGKLPAMTGALGNYERLHESWSLLPIYDHSNVRFNVRFHLGDIIPFIQIIHSPVDATKSLGKSASMSVMPFGRFAIVVYYGNIQP